MPDVVYLSVWLEGFNADNMLQHWSRVLEAFSVSALLPGIRAVSIYPFSWAETPVFERSFGEEGATIEDAVSLGSEFLHDDYAYEAEMTWDLWVQNEPSAADIADADNDPENRGWHIAPVKVSLACLGPQFESEAPEYRADIQVSFGLDWPFVPPEADSAEEEDLDFDPAEAEVRTRENLQVMVGFVHRLDETMPVKKRLLWCESGENLADKIMRAVTGEE